MKVTNGVGTLTRLYIDGAQALDPVTVLIEDILPGAGRITIICWGEVWTSFWGGMSGRSVGEFFLGENSEYLAKNLWGSQKHTKAKAVYLLRIIEAVKSGLAVEAARRQA
ncbi:TPA: hypothetical protein ACSTLU_000116 [Serratia fonticola]